MIEVELKEEEITALLGRLHRHLTDLSPVMNEIGEFLEDQTVRRFDEGVSPEGKPWAPKSATTIAAYERRGQRVDFRPLFGPNTDGIPLRKSFARQYGPDFVEVGTNKNYAAVMQFGARKGAFGTTSRGGSIPWGDIPARPYLGISDADRAGITDIIEEWLARATEGN